MGQDVWYHIVDADVSVLCICDVLYYNKLVIIMIMDNTMFVVALVGNHVFHNYSIQCVIKSIDALDKVRDVIKNRHGIEFEEVSYRFNGGFWKFDNITDNRDISLVVELVNIVE